MAESEPHLHAVILAVVTGLITGLKVWLVSVAIVPGTQRTRKQSTCLVNAVIGKVGSGTQVTGNATNRELAGQLPGALQMLVLLRFHRGTIEQ